MTSKPLQDPNTLAAGAPAPSWNDEEARPSIVGPVLVGIALFIGLAAAIGLVTGVVLLSVRPASAAGVRVLALTGVLLGGAGGCGLTIAAIAVIRRLNRLLEQTAFLGQQAAIQAERGASAPAARGEPEASEAARLLAEIRETLLLPEEHRRRRFEALMEAEVRARLASAEKLANSNDFHRAREQLQFLSDRYGPQERIRSMQIQVEKQAQAAQEMDLRQARDQIQDLMSLNQWDRAEQLVRELAEKYPQAAEATALVQHVYRERQLFEQRYRSRLHEEIQQMVHRRRWQDAAQAARQFITTFPSGADTEALRAQLDTLEANAEIQTRQQLEAQIKEHIRRQEYWDALALARRIISDYPFSPQANVLRGQLAQLEARARSQRG